MSHHVIREFHGVNASWQVSEVIKRALEPTEEVLFWAYVLAGDKDSKPDDLVGYANYLKKFLHLEPNLISDLFKGAQTAYQNTGKQSLLPELEQFFQPHLAAPQAN